MDRFGRNSREHNLVREWLALAVGADIGEYEDEVVEEFGEAGRAYARRFQRQHGLPSVDNWAAFWPPEESRAYAEAVRSASMRRNFRLRKEWRESWARVVDIARQEFGAEYAELPTPSWLE